jgi:nitroimidazol reductase NimA-like FMN-containing flavoprotein (pyridoxamine 5'-phosphate oxidase superfamily)
MYDALNSGYPPQDFFDFILSNCVAVIGVPHEERNVHLTPVYYATENGKDIYMKFHVGSGHGSQIRKDPKVALAIYDHKSTYSEKYGVQLQGICTQVTEREEMLQAIEFFSNKFQGARERFAPIDELLAPNVKSTLFCFRPTFGKMLTPKGYSESYQSLEV